MGLTSLSHMIVNKELEVRLGAVKRFLNAEMTNCKVGKTAMMTIAEVGRYQDSIHELERRGLRHLNDMDMIKMTRVLTSVEARMSLSKN